MTKITFQNLPSTSTPVNATNLNQLQTNVENAINEKNIITIQLGSEFSCTTLDAYTAVTGFVQANKIGDKLSFSNNSIVIGAGVSKIKVTAKAGWYATNTSTKYLRLLKNNSTLVWSTINVPNSSFLSDSIPENLVDVVQGDTISMSYYTAVAGDSLQDSMRTFITVEVVA